MNGKGGNPRARRLSHKVNEVKHPNQTPTIFVALSQAHEANHCPDEVRHPPVCYFWMFSYCLFFILFILLFHYLVKVNNE